MKRYFILGLAVLLVLIGSYFAQVWFIKRIVYQTTDPSFNQLFTRMYLAEIATARSFCWENKGQYVAPVLDQSKTTEIYLKSLATCTLDGKVYVQNGSGWTLPEAKK